MINRPKYLQMLIDSQHNGFPKVITGVRRCGKSYLLETIYKEYLLQNGVDESSIIIMELDDIRNAKYRDPIVLDSYIREKAKDKNVCYVFIDEIQFVDTIVNPIYTNGKHVLATDKDTDVISFVEVVLGLSRTKNIDLYVTGSNSKMLSRDVITQFRDKATNIHICPLSFEEFYSYKGGYPETALHEYLNYGGMPLAVLKNGDDKKEYLKKLFKTTYFKDILDHNDLIKTEALDELCDIIASSTGQIINSEKMAKSYISRRHENINRETIERYINFFVGAYLLEEATRYDVKGKAEIGALKKYYFVDNGLRNARLNFAYNDAGQMLENLIYNELRYHNYSVNVGVLERVEKDQNGRSVKKRYEIDFVAKKGLKEYYIQVCSDFSQRETMEREIKPYLKLNDQLQKIVVVNRPIEESRDQNGFTIIGAVDFLLKFLK